MVHACHCIRLLGALLTVSHPTYCPGFYVAIEQHFDVKKFLGIKGGLSLEVASAHGMCTCMHCLEEAT